MRAVPPVNGPHVTQVNKEFLISTFTENIARHRKINTELFQTVMGEFKFAFLIALVCLIPTSTRQNEKKELCWLESKEVTPLVRTKQGNDVQQTSVQCDLKTQESAVKFDINWALDATKANKNSFVAVYVSFFCWTSIEFDFINPRNTVNKKILLGLSFAGGCKVWTRNLSVFAKATIFRHMSLTGQKATWSSSSTQENDNFISDLSIFHFRDSLPENMPALFNDTKNVWPNVSTMLIERTPIKEIPEQWKMTIPRLQELFLIKCNLTEPPVFPWNNATLEDLLDSKLRFVYEFRSTRTLYLDENSIKDLTSHEFSGFLHVLSLRGNSLKAIGPSCFHNLKGIQTIDLSRNNLASLHQNLFQGLTSLLNIDLGSNNLTVIEQTLFKGLTRIEKITLDHNNLHSIPNGLFSSLSTLESLNLTGNNIEKIEANPFPKDSALQHLYLDKNKLSSFPPWIFSLRKIKLIDLSSNQLTFEDLKTALDEYSIPLDALFMDWKSPEIDLNLSNNNITTLVDCKGLSEIKRDERISPGQQVKYSYLLRAYKIILSGNPLVCDCIMSAVAQEIVKLFPTHSWKRSRFDTWQCHWPLELKNKSILEIGQDQWLRRDTELDDRNCPTKCTCRERCSNGIIVVNCAERNLTVVPSLMPQGLFELNLMSNNIRDIPAYPYLANVTILKLTNNKVERLKASTVKKLKRVEILFIDSNKLTTLPREIESLNLTTLALDQNRFKCDCTTKWIKHWLLKNKGRIRNIDKVFCNSEHALGQPINSLPDDEFICGTIKKNAGKTVRIETIAACTLGGLLALMMTVGIVLYKYHREVKVFMYTHFNWHPYDRTDDSDPNKIYDAFLSFSGNDFDWVVNTLQERLENHDPPYKLCFHHRDFPVGETIVENTFKSVDQSKRMLVVLSSSYAKSDWCLMEFREAHRKVLEDRTKYLIVIMFDDVDTAELDEVFKLYLRSNTYLSVSDKRFWQKLFYAMPLPSARESVEDRGLENVAIDNFGEISQQAEMEMVQNTAETIALVEQ